MDIPQNKSNLGNDNTLPIFKSINTFFKNNDHIRMFSLVLAGTLAGYMLFPLPLEKHAFPGLAKNRP